MPFCMSGSRWTVAASQISSGTNHPRTGVESMSRRKNTPLALLTMLSVTLLGVGTVQAATVERYDYQSAAGVCQGALPAFAGTLRARPLAIGNEGASPAFVTC